MTEYNSLYSVDDIDKEVMYSSPESTPSQVRRRISDVKLTKEKYVDKAKNTISAGKKQRISKTINFHFFYKNNTFYI